MHNPLVHNTKIIYPSTNPRLTIMSNISPETEAILKALQSANKLTTAPTGIPVKAFTGPLAAYKASVAPTAAPLKQEVSKDGGLRHWSTRYITVDPESKAMLEAIVLYGVSRYKDPVLLCGETGTGKEILARIIHGDSIGNFVPINCGGIPPELLESELFGHVKGAFTGAHQDKQGLFSAAHNGTLFLDEVAELPHNMQSKLLRVLQERVVRRVGSTTSETFDCRIVCATHQNLHTLVTAGKFREDLYHRLASIIFRTKPLRDRLCDIEPIAQAMGWSKDVAIGYVTGALSHNISGNVRELQHAIRRYRFQQALEAAGCTYKMPSQ